MSSRAKTLRAKRAKLIVDAQALVAVDNPTADALAQYDRLEAEANAIMAQVERLERADTLAADLGEMIGERAEINGVSADEQKDKQEREKRLLRAWMSRRTNELSDGDRQTIARRAAQTAGFETATAGFENAASIGTAGAGGYTIAPDVQRELLIAEAAWGGMRAVSRVIITGTGVDLPWPKMDDTSQVATIVGENTAGAAGADLVFTNATMKAWMYRSGYLPVPLELLQDSMFSFDTLIHDAMARRFGLGQNNHFTTGNGTTQPEGVITGSTAGKTGLVGQTTGVISDDFIDLEHSIDPNYRPGARYMMHDSSLKVVKKLKDSTGRQLFSAGLDKGAFDTLNGYPITINQSMAVMAANAKSILFGNFNNYVIRDVMGLRLLRLDERFAENGQVAFLGFQRGDGRTVSAAASIKYYANSAT